MRDLIKKVQSGDELAFKQLTATIENDLYKIARTRLNNYEDIKDAVQNTMIIIYEKSKKIRNIEYFKTWMFKVLINECNKIYNSNKKNIEVYNQIVTDYDFNTYEDSIQDAQNRINFESIINKLNYEEKIVLTLYYNSNLSCKQISNILKTNVNTIKSRLTRSKNKLKKYYEEDLKNEERRLR